MAAQHQKGTASILVGRRMHSYLCHCVGAVGLELEFDLQQCSLQVTFYEPDGHASFVASQLAGRVKHIAHRTQCEEAFRPLIHEQCEAGQLCNVLATLEAALGIPQAVIDALYALRAVREKVFVTSDGGSGDVQFSPTIDFPVAEHQQLPVVPISSDCSEQKGLSTKFPLSSSMQDEEEAHTIFAYHADRYYDSQTGFAACDFRPPQVLSLIAIGHWFKVLW